MPRQQEQQHCDPVVAAIERVLKTERDGVETLRQSHETAGQLLAQARAQATAIARRADGCIAKLHTAYLQKLEREIGTLAASRALPAAGDDKVTDAAALVAAARRVAAKLTGGA
jgi:vacuolar-type H+-ATPase subunit H